MSGENAKEKHIGERKHKGDGITAVVEANKQLSEAAPGSWRKQDEEGFRIMPNTKNKNEIDCVLTDSRGILRGVYVVLFSTQEAASTKYTQFLLLRRGTGRIQSAQKAKQTYIREMLR